MGREAARAQRPRPRATPPSAAARRASARRGATDGGPRADRSAPPGGRERQRRRSSRPRRAWRRGGARSGSAEDRRRGPRGWRAGSRSCRPRGRSRARRRAAPRHSDERAPGAANSHSTWRLVVPAARSRPISRTRSPTVMAIVFATRNAPTTRATSPNRKAIGAKRGLSAREAGGGIGSRLDHERLAQLAVKRRLDVRWHDRRSPARRRPPPGPALRSSSRAARGRR